MIFKTEDQSKLLLRDDLPKIIKDISETNKVDQSLTQRYQPKLKRERFTKTEKPFLFKRRSLSAKKKALAESSTISALSTKAAKVLVQQERYSAKPLAPDFQIQVSELVCKIKFLNEKSNAGGISEHINN